MGFALCDALSVSLPTGYFDFGFAYARYNDTFHSVIPRKRLRDSRDPEGRGALFVPLSTGYFNTKPDCSGSV